MGRKHGYPLHVPCTPRPTCRCHASLVGCVLQHCVVQPGLWRRYILDDPTAAVDAWVGHHLFTKCVNGALKGSTRVFVTNHIEQAEAADIVVVMEDGRIVDQGTYEQVSASSVVFRELLQAATDGDADEQGTLDGETKASGGEEARRPSNASRPRTTSDASQAQSRNGRAASAASVDDVELQRTMSSGRGRSVSTAGSTLTESRANHEEVRVCDAVVCAHVCSVLTTLCQKQDKGAVSFALLLRYFRSGASLPMVCCLFFLAAAPELAKTASELWLVRWDCFMACVWCAEWLVTVSVQAGWTEDAFSLTDMQYIAVYVALAGSASVFMFLLVLSVVRLVLRAGATLHRHLLKVRGAVAARRTLLLWPHNWWLHRACSVLQCPSLTKRRRGRC